MTNQAIGCAAVDPGTSFTSLVLRQSPFDQRPGILPVRGGKTLRAILEEAAGTSDLSNNLYVAIGGVEIPRSQWAMVRPKAGVHIHVTRMPAGGSGGKWLRAVLMIVVMVVAMWATGGGAAGLLGSAFGAGTTGAMMLGAGIYMVGALRVPALTPGAAA